MAGADVFFESMYKYMIYYSDLFTMIYYDLFSGFIVVLRILMTLYVYLVIDTRMKQKIEDRTSIWMKILKVNLILDACRTKEIWVSMFENFEWIFIKQVNALKEKNTKF